MKLLLNIAIFIIFISMAACQPATVVSSTQSPPQAESEVNRALKTSMGDFEISAARFVQEANGVTPAEGEKLLLIVLVLPGGLPIDPSSFSLQEFSDMTHDTSQGEIHILGDDGSVTISTMGGWVDDEFTMGFRLPAQAKTYTLIWPGNPPITIVPEG